MRIITVFIAALVLAACASTPKVKNISAPISTAVPLNPISTDTTFYVKSDWAEKAAFLGYIDKTASTATGGNTTYSGDAGIAGLIAQIAVHAAMNNSAQKKQMSAAQKSANQVLNKYSDILEKFSHEWLYSHVANDENDLHYTIQQFKADETPLDSVIIKLNPTYYLTANETSLMLQMEIQAYRQTSPEDIIFEQTAKVISKPITSQEPENIWRKGTPSNFESTSNALFSESLSLLLDDFVSNADEKESAPHKTYKYIFGGKKRYERAALIRQSCDRTYIKNLKGNIVAIPTLIETCDQALNNKSSS